MDGKRDFEKSFELFLESENYDNASDIIFLLARAAFLSGFTSAGGKVSDDVKFEVIKGNKKDK